MTTHHDPLGEREQAPDELEFWKMQAQRYYLELQKIYRRLEETRPDVCIRWSEQAIGALAMSAVREFNNRWNPDIGIASNPFRCSPDNGAQGCGAFNEQFSYVIKLLVSHGKAMALANGFRSGIVKTAKAHAGEGEGEVVVEGRTKMRLRRLPPPAERVRSV